MIVATRPPVFIIEMLHLIIIGEYSLHGIKYALSDIV